MPLISEVMDFANFMRRNGDFDEEDVLSIETSTGLVPTDKNGWFHMNQILEIFPDTTDAMRFQEYLEGKAEEEVAQKTAKKSEPKHPVKKKRR